MKFHVNMTAQELGHALVTAMNDSYDAVREASVFTQQFYDKMAISYNEKEKSDFAVILGDLYSIELQLMQHPELQSA